MGSFLNRKQSFRKLRRLSKCLPVPGLWRRWESSPDLDVVSHQTSQGQGGPLEHSGSTFLTPRETECVAFPKGAFRLHEHLRFLPGIPRAKIPCHLEKEGTQEINKPKTLTKASAPPNTCPTAAPTVLPLTSSFPIQPPPLPVSTCPRASHVTGTRARPRHSGFTSQALLLCSLPKPGSAPQFSSLSTNGTRCCLLSCWERSSGPR